MYSCKPARCNVFGVPRPNHPSDERPPVIKGYFCLVVPAGPILTDTTALYTKERVSYSRLDHTFTKGSSVAQTKKNEHKKLSIFIERFCKL